MRFGELPLREAEGTVLAHSVGLPGGRLRKGRVLCAADLEALAGAGIGAVVAARLEAGDVGEDEAAARVAAAVAPDPAAAGVELTEPFTGRVNFHATLAGVLDVDRAAVDALNRVDPAVTLATLAPFARVAPGRLVATVKIIAYAVPGAAVEAACAVARGALRVRPVVRRTAGLVLTEVPGQAAKLTAKGRRVTEARLASLGVTLNAVRVVDHASAPIAAALADLPGDLALILTGSATSDLHDVAPEGVRLAGGSVARFGMPVDPGNLLFLGAQGGRPVVGMPGCARSPALNGADWVLERLACGIEVSADDIAAMGVGGLLMEIPSRPQPREGGHGPLAGD
ncbi:MAG: molybdopterin-binding protein [Rhodobacteraceae bacterium]|jgi:molybdenum cofactor cytidylyltransferase|nr:molybdopterin-binding protein [Paracoccaceae bacterium]